MPGDTVCSLQSSEFWKAVVKEAVPIGMGDESPAVRAQACDCLSCIKANIFGSLEHSQQILCVTLALGLNSDLVPNVKAAACR